MLNKKYSSKFIAINEVIVCFDYIQLSLINILLTMLLHQGQHFAVDASNKAILIGALISCYAFGQFIGCKYFGDKLSQNNAALLLRNTQALKTLSILCSLIGVLSAKLPLIFIGQTLMGFASGDIAINQCVLIQKSSCQKLKSKALARLQIMIGLAWIIGPLIGLLVHARSPHIESVTLTILLLLMASYATLFIFLLLKKINFKYVLVVNNAHPSPRNFKFNDMTLKLIWIFYVLSSVMFMQYTPAIMLFLLKSQHDLVFVILMTVGVCYTLAQWLLTSKVLEKSIVYYAIMIGLFVQGLTLFMLVRSRETPVWFLGISLFALAMATLRPSLIKVITEYSQNPGVSAAHTFITSSNAIMTLIALVTGGLLLHAHPVLIGDVGFVLSEVAFGLILFRIKKGLTWKIA